MPTQTETKNEITLAYNTLKLEFEKEIALVNDTKTASLLRTKQKTLTHAFNNYKQNTLTQAPAMIITLENIHKDLAARKTRCLGVYIGLATLSALIVLAFLTAFIAAIHFTAPAAISMTTAAISLSADSLSIGFFAGLAADLAAATMTFITGRNKYDEYRAATRILTHLGTFKTKIEAGSTENPPLNNPLHLTPQYGQK